MEKRFYAVEDRPPLQEALPLSIQHLFAMFSASILVPNIFGINPAVVLLFNGIATLIFIAVTKGKSPAYLGSSFAFIAPTLLLINTPGMGYSYALGGFIASGAVFIVVAGIIYLFDSDWINAILPPAAMGAVVALIGLELAGTAASMGGIVPAEDGAALNPESVAIFLLTLATAILGSVLFRGFLSLIPILIAIIVGYIGAFAMGMVDFSMVREAAWFSLPTFTQPKFDLSAIFIILPATLVVLSEHIGHQIVTGQIVGRNLIKEPGLHKTIFADGLTTMISGFGGSVPTTTYGENIGVMAMTKVYSTYVIAGTAIFSVGLAFIGKVAALIMSIPPEVMGGVSFLLYGMIGVSGLRLLVDQRVDYNKARNQILTAIPLVTGLSGAAFQLGAVRLQGMALATVIAILLGIVFALLDKASITNDQE